MNEVNVNICSFQSASKLGRLFTPAVLLMGPRLGSIILWSSGIFLKNKIKASVMLQMVNILISVMG